MNLTFALLAFTLSATIVTAGGDGKKIFTGRRGQNADRNVVDRTLRAAGTGAKRADRFAVTGKTWQPATVSYYGPGSYHYEADKANGKIDPDWDGGSGGSRS